MQICPPLSDAERDAILAGWRARGAAARAKQDVPRTLYRAQTYYPKMIPCRGGAEGGLHFIEVAGRRCAHSTPRGAWLLAARAARAECRKWGWHRG